MLYVIIEENRKWRFSSLEIWKSVPGYDEFYEVSNKGNVRSKERKVRANIRNVKERLIKGKMLKKNLKKNGYYTVDLSKNAKTKTVSVHRLVALAFIPNPNNLPVVNHKNGIKTDNRVENLEWTTHASNHQHAEAIGLRENVGQYQNKTILCVETSIVFKNSVEAAKWILKNEPEKTSLSSFDYEKIARNIRRCATGGTPKAYGYTWKDI